ncbi:hypothetical protein DFH06DRAFT_1218713 [Mycena polygramma]|nr:hypothetical protein DFH06DRAFT_1218713 [Mycena polygramma]
MIPRYSNPHFIQRAIESVARSELFGDQANETSPDGQELELQKKLEELIQSNLDADTSVRVKKRRKLNAEQEDAPETSVLFRLLSDSQRVISLLPPPPPPPVTREPEVEDTESAAETRRQWAAAVAVDAAWVMRESARLPPPFRVGRVQHVQARPALLGAPPLLLAHRLQSRRSTRPPVPRSELQHYPYVSAPVLSSPARTAHIPSVEIEGVEEGRRRRTRKRRRGSTL